MQIVELKTDAEFQAIWPFIRLLNPEMAEATFQARLSTMREGGYRCIAAERSGKTVGIVGFWVGTKFWCGKYMDIDNIVVTEMERSQGTGAALLAWVEAEAARLGCDLVDLPVYTHNHAAHRFYFRNGYVIEGYYFTKRLGTE